ncbi:Hypothetical predicted protein, partial [Pelobates cultripes]
MNFFGHKPSLTADPLQTAGHEERDEAASITPSGTLTDLHIAENLTRSHFEHAMEQMADKLIQTWQQTADQIKREVRDLSARTSAVEKRHTELEAAQTLTSEHLQDLQRKAYARGLMRAYAPDIPADMLLVDRIHRVAKPKNLPDSIPRDVLLRAHYFHIKELVLRAHRSKADPHEDFPSVRIMPDISSATLRRRKDFLRTTTALRTN